MEGFDGEGGKSQRGTWFQVYSAAGTSSDCTLPPKRKNVTKIRLRYKCKRNGSYWLNNKNGWNWFCIVQRYDTSKLLHNHIDCLRAIKRYPCQGIWFFVTREPLPLNYFSSYFSSSSAYVPVLGGMSFYDTLAQSFSIQCLIRVNGNYFQVHVL